MNREAELKSLSRVACSDLLAVCMFFQVVLNFTGREYLDAHRAVEVVGVNVGPVSRLNLNRVSMPQTHHIRLHDIQVT